jgi:putative colanic acid biosynthesis UDP-glucose lipid carrier transferase
MTKNNKSNNLIQYTVIAVDFILLNLLLYLCTLYYPRIVDWTPSKIRLFAITLNVALLISHYFNSPIIHLRVISVGDIIQRIIRLDGLAVLIAYLIMKGISLTQTKVGTQLMEFGIAFFIVLLISRFFERKIIKYYRQSGRNTRRALFIGADSELLTVYNRLNDDASKGYQVLGYYANCEMTDVPDDIRLDRLGSLDEFMKNISMKNMPEVGDEIYVCISRKDRGTIRVISDFCDQKMVRFYYVPVSVETLGIDLKRELLDDIEIFTTYENPLMNPVNKAVKRAFDLLLVLVFLVPMILIFPFIWIIIKIQSPGPIFFKQKRTGLDGKEFEMLKFRSMHVNKDADKLQATKDDPRKYPFGNFMRKSNIDETPQIFNILKGDMSVVGPRPHMLAHTEQYSQLIDKYMVRHFVKPGVTGWAQVTGFRGETSELWQMEGRVKRDIWYMEHWSIWLDIRIIWMTLKTFFVHDKNAY